MGVKKRSYEVIGRCAEHAHITRVHHDGAITLVVMGRLRREWGFWRLGQWFHVHEYERRFGLNWRCEDPWE